MRMRTAATTVTLLSVVVSGCTGDGGTAAPTGATRAVVTDVVDGDTVDVELGGGGETVRLIGVNAPERGECFAEAAAAALRELIAGREVRLERDTSDRDGHGRLLRHVHLDGSWVNEALVRDGYALARAYPPDTARAEELEIAEQRARAEGAGLWGPQGCRAADDHGVELDVRADAPGDDARNPNGEWLEIRNSGGSPLDLSGWTVRDGSASNRYRFPDGTTLPSGATLRLATGCGDDGPDRLHWCHEGSAVWNNDGDTAMLLDGGGRIVATHHYGAASER